MVVRRPLVISGQFLHEADNTDGQVILGSITYGSGLGEQLDNYVDNFTANVLVSAAASGLLLVSEASRFKLALDGSAQTEADAALASGNDALSQVAPAYASGTEAQRLSVEALASGNAGLLANLSGIQLATEGIRQAEIAYASGVAAEAVAEVSLANALNATISGDFAFGSGVAASQNAVSALASGNAALKLLSENPFIDEPTLISLIIGLS
jgi:hypothetical protein